MQKLYNIITITIIDTVVSNDFKINLSESLCINALLMLIQTLIDSVASYNFIPLDVFESLKHSDLQCIEMEPHKQSVQVVNNQLVSTVGQLVMDSTKNIKTLPIFSLFLKEFTEKMIWKSKSYMN